MCPWASASQLGGSALRIGRLSVRPHVPLHPAGEPGSFSRQLGRIPRERRQKGAGPLKAWACDWHGLSSAASVGRSRGRAQVQGQTYRFSLLMVVTTEGEEDEFWPVFNLPQVL